MQQESAVEATDEITTVIRIGNDTDRQLAMQVRRQVFVQEQGVPADAEYDSYESSATHYLATYAGAPVGAARWRVTEHGVKLERFAVLKDFRSQGVGEKLLKVILEDVQAQHPEKKIYLHAQLPAFRFYSRHGFEPEGEQFRECDIEHYKMYFRG
ncbi:GNAT family N-acetyltransferase [Pontibacter qinzhouensis]|uniref:GNAT family N-acetyltransferase n=1 Tax=Pontibacter qinzhouensis TaxID=2603253 RepID=A0A5C8KDP6_9BACT|nr:GNAT family N-acetyltransferase [Pontibacter qinzhouensis]TXK50509.1 GNAT family N-acetyltransferase [Pontibacter qinzhouensis]